MRLGLYEPHHCQCGAIVDARGLHGLSCRRSAGRQQRHSLLNDIAFKSFRRAQVQSHKEPLGLLRSEGKRPDGVTLIPWSSERCLTWDVTVPDTFAASYLPATSLAAGAAAEVTTSNPSLCWWRSHQASGHGTRAQPTRLLQRCIRRPSESTIRPLQRAQNAAARLITDTKPRDHITPVLMHLHWLSIKSRIQYKLCPDAPHSHQPATCLHGRDGWAHCNFFDAVWPPVCQRPPVPEASAENQVRWANSLPHFIQSESNTKLFKKLLLKLTCLHCHFNSFIYFIVCRNMKCPPIYFVGGQYF